VNAVKEYLEAGTGARQSQRDRRTAGEYEVFSGALSGH